MSDNKTYIIGGVSRVGGKLKVRFANDPNRKAVLEKAGHQDIELLKFDSPLSKREIIHVMMNYHTFSVADAYETIEQEAKELGFL